MLGIFQYYKAYLQNILSNPSVSYHKYHTEMANSVLVLLYWIYDLIGNVDFSHILVYN
jgi:hypothetical protein